jgi:thiol-disulfide isomerase/thioredoxin
MRLAPIALAAFAVAVYGEELDTSLLKGTVTVVTFVSARCQVSNAYGARLEALYEEYTPRGVRILFVNANTNESDEEIVENARQHRFRFPIYRDSTSKAADLLGAQLTPETFVLDRDAVVRYRGAIDDARNPARVKKRSLRLALDRVLAGQTVAVPETKAFGCAIKRPRAEERLRPLDTGSYASLVASHKGKILLVEFWATWCAPCREELPRIAALATALPVGSLQLVTVSADEPEQTAAALQFLRAAHAPPPFWQDTSEDHDRFINSVDPSWSGALPAVFLYGRSGRLVHSFLGEVSIPELEAAIRKLL